MFVEEKRDGEVLTPVKPVDEVSFRLLRAADLLRHCGHAKGVIEDRAGRMCVVGAILSAANNKYDGVTYSMCVHRLERNLGLNTRGVSIVDWNNARERTADEVIAALEGAANHVA